MAIPIETTKCGRYGKFVICALIFVSSCICVEPRAADLGKTNSVLNAPHIITNVVIETKLKSIKGRYESSCKLEEKDIKLVVPFAVGSDGVHQLGDGTLSGHLPILPEDGLGYAQEIKSIKSNYSAKKLSDAIVEKRVDGVTRKVRTCRWQIKIITHCSIRTAILTDTSVDAEVAVELGVLEAEKKQRDTKVKPLLGATYSKPRMIEGVQELVFEQALIGKESGEKK